MTRALSTFGRHRRLFATAACLLLASSALPGIAAAQSLTKVRMGLIGINESQIPVLVAVERGFFRDEGIEIERVNFKGGGVAVQAFVGGSIDLASFSTDHVLRLANRGSDARLLIGIDRYMTHVLIAPAAKGYKGLAALKGKKIGVTAPGSYSDNTLRWSLKELGINPDRDATIVGIGGGNTARAGLDSGQIDATMSTTADVLEIQQSQPGRYEILYDWRKIQHSGQAVIGRQKWVDENPRVARGVSGAILKAEQAIQTDPATVQRAVRQQFPQASDAFVKAYSAAVPGLLSPDGHVSDAGFQKMTDILRIVEPDIKPVSKASVDLTDKLLGR